MNALTRILRRDVITIEPNDFKLDPVIILMGADTEKMLRDEEAVIAALDDRRQVIENEITRLQDEHRKTELALAARHAAKKVLIEGGEMPSHA